MFSGEFQKASNKLSQYYLQEFTDIKLYSPSIEKEKVPLDKLYVAMKWIRCNKEKQGSDSIEPDGIPKECDNICDYNQIFGKVYTHVLLTCLYYSLQIHFLRPILKLFFCFEYLF